MRRRFTLAQATMDHILYWNAVALEANRRDFTTQPGAAGPAQEQGGPTLSSRALAIVHLAMYDAHAGCVGAGVMPRYLPSPPSPGGGSADAAAAVAAAAHRCLSVLFSKQISHFDQALADAELPEAGTSAPADAGLAFGRQVADAMLADRAGDPGAGDVGYTAPVGHGLHRSDPGAAHPQPFHGVWYGSRSKCFAVTARHTLNAPPPTSDAEYQRALAQVRGRGIDPQLMGTLPGGFKPRTVDQTLIGIYWAYDGVEKLGTPPRLYNLIVRELASQRSTSVDENARLFALVNTAMGDAGILAWDDKYRFNVWRPVLGVREHDPSMGPGSTTPANDINNDCDPNWMPLGAPDSNKDPAKARDFTPPFPAYPSGHATFGAAALHSARLFFDDSLRGNRGPDTLFAGSFVSEECDGITRDARGIQRPRHARSFPKGLWQMIEENGLSRVYLGVHWSFDAFALDAQGKPDLSQNIGGVPLGLKIAEDVVRAGLKAPVKSTVGPRL